MLRRFGDLFNSVPANDGARTQRPLWTSTSTKNPDAPDLLYVDALAAPSIINIMPEATLAALAEHGKPAKLMEPDGGDAVETLAAFTAAGIDHQALATRLQVEGAATFDRSRKSQHEQLARG